ncbi:MAG: polysaccharide biosynthesis protein, partial [Christensenellales bacterium]
MNQYKTLSKNTVIFAIGQLSVKVIQFFLMPLVTVSLTSADYGIAENISSLVELLMPLFTLGLTDAVFRFSMRDNISPKTVLTTSMTVALSGILIIA